MGAGARRTAVARTVVLVGLVLLSTAACSHAGDLAIANNGPEDVVVRTGDEGVGPVEVTSGGGVVLLDYGCTSGDVTVEFPSADPVVLPGPVCSDQEIRIGDGTAHLLPAVPGDDGGSDAD